MLLADNYQKFVTLGIKQTLLYLARQIEVLNAIVKLKL